MVKKNGQIDFTLLFRYRKKVIKFFVNPIIKEAENSQTLTPPQPEITQEKKLFSAKFRGSASIALWIFLILLTPVTLFGIISQNSIPGDFLYPIKRSYESVALAFASTRPETKADYTAQLAQKRFDEASTLLLTKADTQGLQTFVEQITAAQENISSVKNVEEKEKLQKSLLVSISQYQENLSKVQEEVAPSNQIQTPPTIAYNYAPTNLETNAQIQSAPINNQPTPTTQAPEPGTPAVITSAPYQAPATPSPTTYAPPPAATTIPTSAPSPVTITPPTKEAVIAIEIDKTQRALDKLKDQLSQSSANSSIIPTPTEINNPTITQKLKETDRKKDDDSQAEKNKKKGRD